VPGPGVMRSAGDSWSSRCPGAPIDHMESPPGRGAARVVRRGVPAPALPAARDDLYQLRDPGRAGHPDGRLHPPPTKSPAQPWSSCWPCPHPSTASVAGKLIRPVLVTWCRSRARPPGPALTRPDVHKKPQNDLSGPKPRRVTAFAVQPAKGPTAVIQSIITSSHEVT
jgi:hypothetical protein